MLEVNITGLSKDFAFNLRGDTEAVGDRMTRGPMIFLVDGDRVGLSPNEGSGLMLERVVSNEWMGPMGPRAFWSWSEGTGGTLVVIMDWLNAKGGATPDWCTLDGTDGSEGGDTFTTMKCKSAQKKRHEEPIIVKLCCNSVHDP